MFSEKKSRFFDKLIIKNDLNEFLYKNSFLQAPPIGHKMWKIDENELLEKNNLKIGLDNLQSFKMIGIAM